MCEADPGEVEVEGRAIKLKMQRGDRIQQLAHEDRADVGVQGRWSWKEKA